MKFKIEIMGAVWLVKLLSDFEFIAEHGDETLAVTLTDKKEIHFQTEHRALATIRHEVRHAFTAELCIASAEITTEQMEEIQCTLDEGRWEQMDALSRKIYAKIL